MATGWIICQANMLIPGQGQMIKSVGCNKVPGYNQLKCGIEQYETRACIA